MNEYEYSTNQLFINLARYLYNPQKTEKILRLVYYKKVVTWDLQIF